MSGRGLGLNRPPSVPAETVRAMTHVINQGMAMYWGTSRWSAMEIMVSWGPRGWGGVALRRLRPD